MNDETINKLNSLKENLKNEETDLSGSDEFADKLNSLKKQRKQFAPKSKMEIKFEKIKQYIEEELKNDEIDKFLEYMNILKEENKHE